MGNMFKGTGVALVTPFHEDLSVDYTALGQLVDHVTAGGVDFLVVMGTTGESPTLAENEKIEVLKFVKSRNSNNLPIVYGLGGNDTAALVKRYQEFEEEVDAFLAVCPYYNRPAQKGLQAHFEAIAEVAKKPIILYNVPKRTGCNLDTETVLALAKHPNIIGIKEASGSRVIQAEEIARKMPADFVLTSGDDDLIHPFIKIGGHGVISVIANALPSQTSSLVNKSIAGESQPNGVIADEFDQILNLIFAEGNPSGVKVMLKHLGIGNEVVRLPLVPASDELTAKIMAVTDQIQALSE